MRIRLLPVTAFKGLSQGITSTLSFSSSLTASMGPVLLLKIRTCLMQGNWASIPLMPDLAWAPHPQTERTFGPGRHRCLACTTPWPPAVRMAVMFSAPTSAIGDPLFVSLKMTRVPWQNG